MVRGILKTDGQVVGYLCRVAILLFEYGRSSTRRILEAQTDLVSAQNNYTEALVNFGIATLEFYRDAGVLQVKPDGMWEL